MGEFSILATRLKELRTSLKMTQVEFSDVAGFTSTTLSAYENNQKKPSLDIIMDIAMDFNVSIDWLCGLSNDKNPGGDIEYFSDVIELLFKMDEVLKISITYEAADYGEYDVSDAALHFNNKVMVEFFSEWSKMKDLHDNGIIDEEVYALWIEKTLTKYRISAKVLPFMNIPDATEDNGGLPFK